MTARERARDVLAKSIFRSPHTYADMLLSALDEAGIALVDAEAVGWQYEDEEEGFEDVEIVSRADAEKIALRFTAPETIPELRTTGRVRPLYAGDPETVEVGE